MKESRRGKQKRDSEEYLEPPASLKTQKIVSENYIDTVVNMWRQFLQPHTHMYLLLTQKLIFIYIFFFLSKPQISFSFSLSFHFHFTPNEVTHLPVLEISI